MAVRIRPDSSGYALIISNDYQDTPPIAGWGLVLPALTGTKEDAKKMNETFKALNFETRREHNVTQARFMQFVNETAQCTNYPKNCKAIAVVFSGHGHSCNYLYMQDGNSVSINEVVEQFLPRSAPAIGNIPKLFFVDACRGNERVQAVTVPRGAQCEVLQKGGNNAATIRVPSEGNFLLAYSTMPNYKAYEFKGKGGIWMTTLATKLRSSRGSVEDVLSLVNQELVQAYQSPELKDRMQQPEKVSRLNQVVCLHPESGTDKPENSPGASLSDQPVLGRSFSEEAGQYRGLLNNMYQTQQITKPVFTAFEPKGTVLGFIGKVAFTRLSDGMEVNHQSPEIESSKALAQEKAAKQAWRWIRRSTARSATVRVPPTQNQSTPLMKANSFPVANDHITSPPAPSPLSVPATVGGSPGKTSASRLKEYCDKQYCGDPVYTELPVSGEQRFQYRVTVKMPQPVKAEGEVCPNKKEAKQSAAQKALLILRP